MSYDKPMKANPWKGRLPPGWRVEKHDRTWLIIDADNRSVTATEINKQFPLEATLRACWAKYIVPAARDGVFVLQRIPWLKHLKV